MPWFEPQRSTLRIGGGELALARWGAGRTPVLASHGITANGHSFGQLAWALRELEADVTLYALDHRGRGGSAGHAGPYGLRTHAADLIAVLDHLDVGQAVLVGHSMGAYVAALAAELAAPRITALIAVDGALPLAKPLPQDADVEAIVHAVIGPALERLDMVFDSPTSYLDHWREHPAFSDGACDDVLSAHLANDLVVGDDGWRSPVSKRAVLDDGRGTLTDAVVVSAVERIRQPTTLLWARRGMLGRPPGLLDERVVREASTRLDHLETVCVEDVNHYTILFSTHGAARIAQALIAATASGPTSTGTFPRRSPSTGGPALD